MKQTLQILGAIIYFPPPVSKPVKVKIAALVAGLIASYNGSKAFTAC